MRHLKKTAKLGRTSSHRNAMLSNLVSSLIRHRRVTTTLAKAKAAKPMAEKMVTLGKEGSLHAKRLATARLHHKRKRMLPSKKLKAKAHEGDVVRILFDEIAPSMKNRNGGYTRIIKLPNRRQGDAGQLAILEWVESTTSTAPAQKELPAEEKAESGEQKPAEPAESTSEEQGKSEEEGKKETT